MSERCPREAWQRWASPDNAKHSPWWGLDTPAPTTGSELVLRGSRHAGKRQRISWTSASFMFSGVTHTDSDTMLVSAGMVPFEASTSISTVL